MFMKTEYLFEYRYTMCCVQGESNPQLNLGRVSCYHYTMNAYSEDRFRSYDPRVMSPVRFLCATSLCALLDGFEPPTFWLTAKCSTC